MKKIFLLLVVCSVIHTQDVPDSKETAEIVIPQLPPLPEPKKVPVMTDSKEKLQEYFSKETTEQIVELLAPLIQAHDVKKIIEVITNNIPKENGDKARDILRMLLTSDRFNLSKQEKLSILFAASIHYANELYPPFPFLDIMLADEKLIKKYPIAYVAAKTGNEYAIKRVIRWADYSKTRVKPELQPFLANVGKNSIFFAAMNNEKNIIQTLNTYNVQISPKDATDILWKIVEQNKDPELIKKMIDLYKADVKTAKNGSTLLIRAVKNRNLPMVKALLANKADINYIADPNIGSPVQNAVEVRDLIIESYLRDKGARE